MRLLLFVLIKDTLIFDNIIFVLIIFICQNNSGEGLNTHVKIYY